MDVMACPAAAPAARRMRLRVVFMVGLCWCLAGAGNERSVGALVAADDGAGAAPGREVAAEEDDGAQDGDQDDGIELVHGVDFWSLVSGLWSLELKQLGILFVDGAPGAGQGAVAGFRDALRGLAEIGRQFAVADAPRRAGNACRLLDVEFDQAAPHPAGGRGVAGAHAPGDLLGDGVVQLVVG